jgi:hypothetical protein
MNKTAILRHQSTNKLYRHNQGDNYTNLHSGKSGDIPPEQAQRIFKINVEATALFNEYPALEHMVKRLKLICGDNF